MSFRWRLYYYDGSTFDDHDGEPWQSPTEGVVLVGQFEYVKWTDVLNNAYAYLYRDDLECWTQTGDEVGLRDQLSIHAKNINAVRYGFWMEREKFRAIATRGREEVNEMRRAAGLME